MSTPSVSPECARLLHELRELRERSAQAREESAALGEAALWAGARTLATRDAMWHNRLQWRAWRAGWARWRQQSGADVLPPPRICIVCEAVSFTLPARAAGSMADGVDGTWVTMPAAIRERVRSQAAEFALTPDVCTRCVQGFDADHELATAECAETEAWRQEVARMLLQVFAELDDMAAEMTAEMPWVDPQEALDRTLASAIERLRARIPLAAMSAFVDAVHGLVQRLRDEPLPPCAPPPGGGSGSGSRGAPGRFHPALQRT